MKSPLDLMIMGVKIFIYAVEPRNNVKFTYNPKPERNVNFVYLE